MRLNHKTILLVLLPLSAVLILVYVSPARHHIYEGKISENAQTAKYSVRFQNSWTRQWLQKRETAMKFSHHKKVLLFCYMRGGSTFFSEFFRKNSEVMYWYEPIDSLYMALYGQRQWNKPLDLFLRKDSGGNFTLRTPLPAWEVSAIAEFNHHLLECDFNNLPVELFDHMGSPTLKCTQQWRNMSATETGYCDLKTLQQQVSSHCRGNIAVAIQNNCANHIRAADRLIRDGNLQNKTVIPDHFLFYSNCRKYQMKNIIEHCLPPLANKCRQSKLVVYKGLRYTMESVDAMLQRTPDMHVIYLVRDPRSIVSSTIQNSMAFSGSFKSAVLEAKYLCQKILHDYKIYKELEKTYPGVFTFVRYEDLVKDRYSTVENIYKYLQIKIHQSLFDWIKQNILVKNNGGAQSTARANSSASLDMWRRVNSVAVQQGMTRNCEQVLRTLGYDYGI